jgi:hypothetical protein
MRQELAKGEVLMILNLRPTSSAVLSTMVEDMEERFSEDEQNKILDIITEVLGQDDPSGANGQAQDDANAMPSIENGAA